MSLQNTNRLNKRNMESLLRSLTPPMIYEVVRDLKIRLRRTAKYRKYKIGQHVITIPGDHTLPAFQGVSRLYDRFLPVLCSQLPPQGVIVDVGANVGDTTAAIIQTCTNRIIAIAYFEILRGNPTVVDPDRHVTAASSDPAHRSDHSSRIEELAHSTTSALPGCNRLTTSSRAGLIKSFCSRSIRTGWIPTSFFRVSP